MLARATATSLTVSQVVEETDERFVLRGGNPHRIWVVSERLATDRSWPRPRWGCLFRAEFLRLLRSPRAEQLAR
jgi:hypothetical protein